MAPRRLVGHDPVEGTSCIEVGREIERYSVEEQVWSVRRRDGCAARTSATGSSHVGDRRGGWGSRRVVRTLSSAQMMTPIASTSLGTRRSLHDSRARTPRTMAYLVISRN
jgi:hypothetical protein